MSVSIELDTTDYDQRITAVFLQALPKLGHRFIDEASKIIFARWLEIINVRTGHMRDTSTRAVFDDIAIISTTSGYGALANSGFAAHRIEARIADVLVFEVDGQTLFRKWANHPGYPGSHFAERSIEDTREDVINRLREVYLEEVT